MLINRSEPVLVTLEPEAQEIETEYESNVDVAKIIAENKTLREERDKFVKSFQVNLNSKFWM